MTARMCSRVFYRPNCTSQLCHNTRGFSSSPSTFAGHNKWSQIKHDKAKNDRAKGSERQLISKEIYTASKIGGPEPKFNTRLSNAMAHARRIGIPRVNIETAIARGQGKSVTGEALEHVTIQARLRYSVSAIIECETDKRNRVLQDVRHIIRERGGEVTPTTFLFEKKGRIIFEKREETNPDDYLDQAIEAGAVDIASDEDGRLVAITDPTETKRVGETLSELTGLSIDELEIIWYPNRDTLIPLDKEEATDLGRVLDAIREDPSVRDIYLNNTTKT